MANSFVRDSAGEYPTRFNKRELKVIEAAVAATQFKAVEFAAAATDYAITNVDGYSAIVVNDAITVTLPNASDNSGRRILFTQKATAVLTIAQNADGANIIGANENMDDVATAGEYVELVSTGTEWVSSIIGYT